MVSEVPEPRQAMKAADLAIWACNPRVTESNLCDLVRAADPRELRRLLLRVIPENARALLARQDARLATVLARLRMLFDVAFCFADDDIKNAVVNSFVAALDEQDAVMCRARDALFRPKYLHYFSSPARKRMLRHVLGRLQEELASPPLELIEGVEEFLFDEDDLLAWLRVVVVASLLAPAEAAAAVRRYAQHAYSAMDSAHKRLIADKQAVVIRECEEEGNHGLALMLRKLQDEWAIPAPNSVKRAAG